MKLCDVAALQGNFNQSNENVSQPIALEFAISTCINRAGGNP